MSAKRAKRQIDALWRDGDWYADAWFLRHLDGINARRGRPRYTHERLVELAEVLAGLFPPEVCRRQLERSKGGGHLGGLFFEVWGHLVPLLEVAELVSCAVAVPDRLRARLAIPEEFVAAQFELELLAAGRVAGLPIDHEPLGRAGPDLRIVHDHREYFVEAKLLERSDVATRANEIERELSLFLAEHTDRNVLLTLDTGSGEPLLLDRRGRELIDQVAGCARAACEDFVANGFERRRIHIDGIGMLTIGAPEVGSWACVSLFVLENDEYDSERAVRLVRDAAEQLPARGRRIVIVQMDRDADVEDAARLYKARARVRGPHYVNVDLVVFRQGGNATGRIVATPGEHITPADHGLIHVLTQEMPPDRPGYSPRLLLL